MVWLQRRCELILSCWPAAGASAAAAVPNQHLGVSFAVVLPLRLGPLVFSVFCFRFFCSIFCSLCSLSLFRYRASDPSLEARSTNLAAARTIYCEQSATRLLCSFFRSRCLLSLFRYCASVLSLEARSTNLAAARTIFVSSPPPACCSSTVDSPTPSSVCVCSSGYLS